MSTPYSEVFKAFLGKINDFDKTLVSDEVLEADMVTLLNAAIPYFRLPRKDLSLRDDYLKEFEEDLNNDEIQILSSLMKREWYKRFISDTEVTIQKFGENDFEFKSQANHLKALVAGQTESLDKEVKKMISNYSRTPDNKIFDYSRLVGKK